MSQDISQQARFIRLLARRLHEYGAGSHRLEGAVKSVAERLNLHCEIFSTPTSVFLTFGGAASGSDTEVDRPVSPAQLIRLNPGQVDLGRMCEVDALGEAVAGGQMSLEEGTQRLAQLECSAPVFPLGVVLLAWGVVGFAVSALLGGDWSDMGLAFVLAAMTGTMTAFLKRLQDLGSFEPIAAFIVTSSAYLLSVPLGGANVPVVVIGALIMLMPGLDLTVAMSELATRHLASGTARFAGALIGLAKLALGVVMATQVMTALGFSANTESADLIPDWIAWPAVLMSGVAFCVLFGAQVRHYAAVIVAAFLTYGVNFYASAQTGPDVGIFLAALTVAALSNLHSRLFNVPASVTRLPAILLLVPGSLGYRALTLLFSHNVDEGLTAAVSVVLVLAALVGGLLMGNTLVPPRRHL
ncbi:MAG: threonine/serine exporter family protein [Xanthomonadales bacterium]|nr:threonine/serine exporter family protein [Xanthomonadales bacterium]